jgi:hypothetical protein
MTTSSSPARPQRPHDALIARRAGDVARPRPAKGSERRAIAHEVILVVAAWLLYFGIRAVSQGREAAAIAHARTVVHLEQALGMNWESTIQSAALDRHWLMTAANWVYIWGHWPVIAGAAVWLWRRDRDTYRLLRDAMFLSGAVGLAVFALYPVAPPRLAPFGLVDSVMRWSHAYRALQPPSLTNPYAAMPSLHFGWDLLVGIMLVLRARHVLVRAAGVLLPAAMALAVVATANHFVIDVVAGGVLALAGLWAAVALRRATVRK